MAKQKEVEKEVRVERKEEPKIEKNENLLRKNSGNLKIG